MSTISLIFTLVIGFYLFLFFYWRGLRDDHVHAKVFSSGLVLLIGLIAGGLSGTIISSILPTTKIFTNSGLWFWGGIVGSLIALLVIKYRYKFRMNEVFEASMLGYLVLGLLLSFSSLVIVKQLSSGIATGVMAILVVLFLILKKSYKRFSWYKSGRVGFAALSVASLFFLLRSFLAIFFLPNMVSFIGKVDGIVSSICAFILFLIFYNLAQGK